MTCYYTVFSLDPQDLLQAEHLDRRWISKRWKNTINRRRKWPEEEEEQEIGRAEGDGNESPGTTADRRPKYSLGAGVVPPFDPSPEWHEVAGHSSNCLMGCGTLGSKIFLVGGYMPEAPDDSYDADDPYRGEIHSHDAYALDILNLHDGFATVIRSPVAKLQPLVIELGGRLYIVGGSYYEMLFYSVDEFDPSSSFDEEELDDYFGGWRKDFKLNGKWSQLPRPPFTSKDYFHVESCLVFGPDLYISTYDCGIYYFDRKLEKWVESSMFGPGVPFRFEETSAIVVHHDPKKVSFVVCFISGWLFVSEIVGGKCQHTECVACVAPSNYRTAKFTKIGYQKFCLATSCSVDTSYMLDVFIVAFKFTPIESCPGDKQIGSSSSPPRNFEFEFLGYHVYDPYPKYFPETHATVRLVGCFAI